MEWGGGREASAGGGGWRQGEEAEERGAGEGGKGGLAFVGEFFRPFEFIPREVEKSAGVGWEGQHAHTCTNKADGGRTSSARGSSLSSFAFCPLRLKRLRTGKSALSAATIGRPRLELGAPTFKLHA